MTNTSDDVFPDSWLLPNVECDIAGRALLVEAQRSTGRTLSTRRIHG